MRATSDAAAGFRAHGVARTAVAREYVRRNIPLSLMVIDFFSWDDPVKKVNTIGDETLPASSASVRAQTGGWSCR